MRSRVSVSLALAFGWLVAGAPWASLAAAESSSIDARSPSPLAATRIQLESPASSIANAANTAFEAGGAPELTLAARGGAPDFLAQRITDTRPADERSKLAEVFTAERARILLRSLTIPGWGQATAGHRTSAAVFGLAEAGIWASFTAFRIQEQLRRESYERTAFLLAGIDLSKRDEEFRRIVGSYLSSEQYNHLVVFRDAANLHYDDPAAYRQYIAEHELGPEDYWSWRSEEDLIRYRAQRQHMQKAGRRANAALALAVINRLVSSVHAARAHGASGRPSTPRSWNFEVMPSDPDDATAFQLGVRARF